MLRACGRMALCGTVKAIILPNFSFVFCDNFSRIESVPAIRTRLFNEYIMSTILALEQVSRDRRQLSFRYRYGNLVFNTSYWYEHVDLHGLERSYGEDFMQWLYFHIAAFDLNKICSLRPDALDLGDYRQFCTPAFAVFWRTILHSVWAQWRSENDDAGYCGPRFTAIAADTPAPVVRSPGEARILSLCGGGKDSLVAGRLLSELGVRHDTLVYASSVYGAHDHQHRLIEPVARQSRPDTVFRQWIFDDFDQAPVFRLYPEVPARTRTAAETPSAVFAALPVALQAGATHMALAHERSADTGQLVWQATGEAVNHQWGKSLEAETLLADYVRRHLVADLHYFSILKPVYDVLIFNMLRDCREAVPLTHSCNIAKAWCHRCPKCAYVHLVYAAYLDRGTLDRTFDDNPLDIETNLLTYRQMLGVEDRLPFECIGQADEVRLAFALCARKGIGGRAIDMARRADPDLDVPRIVDRYLTVDTDHSNIPPFLRDRLAGRFGQAAADARRYIGSVLGRDGGSVRPPHKPALGRGEAPVLTGAA